MDARILSRMIERAQKKVEEHYFESRKHVLQYDDVMNKQREVIYGERRRILEGANLRETILGFLRQTVADSVEIFCPEGEMEQNWDLDGLYEGLEEYFPLSVYAKRADLDGKAKHDLQDYITELIEQAYSDKEQQIAEVTGEAEVMRDFEHRVALEVINRKWMEHLAAMDYLREGIFLRGYAQQDPLIVYQKEAFEMFETMQHAIQDEIARFMFHIQLVQEQDAQPEPPKKYNDWTSLDNGGSTTPGLSGMPGGSQPLKGPHGKKPGRNEPCWCGSGKKYKSCHYPD